jgi:hypothetical protein
MVDENPAKVRRPSRSIRSARPGNRHGEKARFGHRTLLVLLPGLVGVAGLTHDVTVTVTAAAIALFLGVIGALGEARLRERHSELPVQRRNSQVDDTSGIFISYRHDDTGPYARLLQVYLHERFPHASVFMDLDSIEAGTDFAEAITAGVGSCCVLIALIGPNWLTLKDEEGQRRLDNPDDWVRFEIRAALLSRVRVIPVLIDGVKIPKQQQLPTDLCHLTRLSALEMSYDRYEYDTSRLAAVIQKALATGIDRES